jgi:hypothetical protein
MGLSRPVMGLLYIYLYMFRALLDHPQEVLHKRHLVYCVRVISVGCIRIEASTSANITHTQYTKCRLFSTYCGRASMLETCSGP